MATGNATVTVTRGTGMDVGCKRDALRAINGDLRMIGSGLTRKAYADDRSRIVYKIESRGYPGSNRQEYDTFSGSALRDRGLAQYGTPVALYTIATDDGPIDVLAMPFRSDASHAAPMAELVRFRNRGGLRLPDMHGGNYRVTAGGRIKITDLGFGVSAR